MDDFLLPHDGLVRAADHRRHRSTLSRLAARGELLWACPGVLMHPRLARDPEAWVRAALLWQPDAVVGGRLAANWGAALALDVQKVHLHSGTRHRPGGMLTILPPDIPEHLISWRGSVPYSSPDATCLVAGLLDDHDTTTALLRSRQVTPKSLMAAAQSWSGRRRSARLAVAHDLSRNPWSVAELQAHRLLRQHGVTGWVGNLPVVVDGQRFVIDVALPEMRVGFEINSFAFHSSRQEMERDSSKMNSLTREGWDMYVITPRQVTDLAEETATFIRSVLNQRHRRGRT